MSKISFLDKLKVLLEVSKSSFLPIIVIILLVTLGVIFATTNKDNAKKRKILYISLILIATFILVIMNFKSLGKIFDYMMNNLFIAIYFPNLAIYFAAIIIMNIILWVSIFNYRTSEAIKRLNIIIYIIMNYLLALILNIVSTNKLDVFNQSSIYQDEKATALIELSSTIFMVWIIFLILYKIILIYVRKDYRPKIKKVIIRRKVKMLPENFVPMQIPKYIYGNIKRTNEAVEPFIKPIPDFNELALQTSKQSTIKLDPVVEERKRILEENQKITEQFDKMLTVDDYKLLLKMLSEQKEKEKFESIKKLETEKIKEEAKIKQQKLAEEAKLQQMKLVEEAKIQAENKAKVEAEKRKIEEQKQEIIKLEEERKQALEKEKQRIAEIKLQEQLKIEEVKQQELEKEQEKFTELEMLYRSVR